MLEKDLQRKVIEFLKKTGAWFYHPRESKKGTDGIPDIVGCLNGLFFAIELKNPDGRIKLRPEQERVLYEINEAGGFILVTNEFNEVVKFINKLRRLKCQPNQRNRGG